MRRSYRCFLAFWFSICPLSILGSNIHTFKRTNKHAHTYRAEQLYGDTKWEGFDVELFGGWLIDFLLIRILLLIFSSINTVLLYCVVPGGWVCLFSLFFSLMKEKPFHPYTQAHLYNLKGTRTEGDGQMDELRGRKRRVTPNG